MGLNARFRPNDKNHDAGYYRGKEEERRAPSPLAEEEKMSRIKDLQKRVHRELESMGDYERYAKAMDHLHGVSFAAAIIAKRRGEDEELAAMAGLLHDLFAYKRGSYEDHAHLGADYVRKLLEKLELTTPEENEIICSAIRHHSDKDIRNSPMDEVLKDADVLHHTLDDPTKEVKEHERERYANLCREFGILEKHPQ